MTQLAENATFVIIRLSQSVNYWQSHSRIPIH